jgi:hypothetical protein
MCLFFYHLQESKVGQHLAFRISCTFWSSAWESFVTKKRERSVYGLFKWVMSLTISSPGTLALFFVHWYDWRLSQDPRSKTYHPMKRSVPIP